MQGVTCRGGNGIAVGSLGQYLEDSSVNNLWVDDVKIVRYNEDMKNGAYIKTWIGELAPQEGYESAGLPRGGGWGTVSNILFSNFMLDEPNLATAITQGNGDNGSFAGTSNMLVNNVAFVNFTGLTNTSATTNPRGSEVSCSTRHPCYNIDYQNFNVSSGTNTTALTTECEYTEPGGVHGVECIAR